MSQAPAEYQRQLGERVAKVETQLSEFRHDIEHVREEIEKPDRGIRARLHELEGSDAAANAGRLALEAAKEMNQRTTDRSFTRKEKIVGLVFGFVVLLLQMLQIALNHGG